MASDDKQRDIALEILDYLLDRPDAQDTIEGIAEWWLLEQQLKHMTHEVQTALDDLVFKEWITVQQQRDGRLLYRLNRTKLPQIEQRLKRKGAK